MSTAVVTTPRRLSLANVRTGQAKSPDRILLMGTPGVGKSTWAAGAPSPIFLCAEDGMPRALADIPRFPSPESTDDILDALRSLTNDPHDYKSLVIDTVDWMEAIVWRSLCERNGWKDKTGNPSIEAPGYGKGYTAATEEMRRVVAALETLRNKRGMEVILLAHAAIKVFQNPAGSDYARYESKLHKGAGALFSEWCDVVLFAQYEEISTEKDIEKKGKSIATGLRLVHTERAAAWDAKNRHGLPPVLPLDYAEYARARDAGTPADPAVLKLDALAALAASDLDDTARAQAAALIETNAGNGPRLSALTNRLRARAKKEA